MAKIIDNVSCEGCAGKCCRYIAVQIDKPKSKRDYDNLRWMLHHDKTEIYIDHENDWVLQVDALCSKLDPRTYRCKIYKKRPMICEELELADCERHGHEEDEIVFKTPDDLDAWLASKKRKKSRKK